MRQNVKKIDLLTDWQKNFVFGLGEAILRERNAEGELIYELLMCTNPFDEIMYLNSNFKEFNPESVIYKYCWSRDYEEEYWAEEKEEECKRLEEFREHLLNIGDKVDTTLLEVEYAEMLKICQSALNNGNKLYLIADEY